MHRQPQKPIFYDDFCDQIVTSIFGNNKIKKTFLQDKIGIIRDIFYKLHDFFFRFPAILPVNRQADLLFGKPFDPHQINDILS